MSARFVTNFVVLLLGAAVLVLLYSLGRGVADWVALGAGAGSIVLAMYSFACREQGIYQRIADGAIATVGAWAWTVGTTQLTSPTSVEPTAGSRLASKGTVKSARGASVGAMPIVL